MEINEKEFNNDYELDEEVLEEEKDNFNRNIGIVLIILLVFVFFTGSTGVPTKMQCTTTSIPEQVLKIEDKIYKEASKQGIPEEYHAYIIALVSQESGGRGNDPFQASESKCGSIGCIKSVDESIEAGIKAFKGRIKYIESKKREPSPELILQMYNYGSAYLDWLILEKKEHSEDSAKAFSKKMCGMAGTSESTAVNEDKSACYGDYKYVEHVSKHLDCSVEEYFDSSEGFGYPYKKKYHITQKFGVYNSMYSNGRHLGIDLDAGAGEDLIAVHDGIVTRMENSSTGYGSHVYIKVRKDLYIVYAHMINGSIKVSKGSKIRKGQVIGKQGNTGFSFGSHLHLEFRKDDIGVQSYNLVYDPNKFIDLKKRSVNGSGW